MMIAAQPKHFGPGDGKTYQLGRMTLTFKTTAVDNGNAYTLCETIEPPDSGAGLHRHPSYDETHIICEGHFDCQLGERMLKVGPGDMMFVPKGTPHSVKSIGPETGRELIISSPGGIFDAFIDEIVTSVINGGSPSKPGQATDFRAIAAKYGIEFLS
jgi:mannose-6-phosphate isomerase-like protein (cupin superfamily)